jgi:hypothetical protein
MAKGKRKPESPFTGCWQIVSNNLWDMIDDDEPSYLEFGADQRGEFQFGSTRGNIDYRVTERDGQPAIEWTWEGKDQTTPCTGQGWAVLKVEELHGMMFFQGGGDSKFVAQRAEGLKQRRGK